MSTSLISISGKIKSHVYFDFLPNAGKKERVPDFVFLAHAVDVSSSMHAPFVNRAIASFPYTAVSVMLPFWPVSFMVLLAMWAKAKTFMLSFYNLKGRLHATWVVPRTGFQACLQIQLG